MLAVDAIQVRLLLGDSKLVNDAVARDLKKAYACDGVKDYEGLMAATYIQEGRRLQYYCCSDGDGDIERDGSVGIPLQPPFLNAEVPPLHRPGTPAAPQSLKARNPKRQTFRPQI